MWTHYSYQLLGCGISAQGRQLPGVWFLQRLLRNPPFDASGGLLGAEFLKVSFSLSLLIMGVAVIVEPPRAGWFYGSTMSYDISFAVCGGAILLNGIIIYPLTCGIWKRPAILTLLRSFHF